MRIYVDTNVYLDYLLERKNRSGDPLDVKAFGILFRARSCEFEIIISDHTLNELLRQVEPTQTEMLWRILRHKMVPVRTRPEDLAAARLLPTHLSDALHVILARDAGAEVLVTRDVADFRDLIEAKRPEDI